MFCSTQKQLKNTFMSNEENTTKQIRLFRNLFERENTITGRQRVGLLVFCYIPIMLLGVTANFLGLTEPTATFFNYTHTACLATAATFLLLYYKGNISVKMCLAAFTIIGQTIISIEMVFCALRPTPYYTMLILANTVLLAMNTTVSLAAYMQRNTLLLGIATIAVYLACAFISGDGLLKSFIIVFAIAFSFVSLVGMGLAEVSNNLERENERLKKEEMELLHILRLKKDEVRAFISLAEKENTTDGIKIFLERLDKKSRINLLNNVGKYLKNNNTELSTIEKVFPEFTPSEREICRLILQDKKLGEICLTLGKSESNINSQRTNMRKKLGLQPADNLQQKLLSRLESLSVQSV